MNIEHIPADRRAAIVLFVESKEDFPVNFDPYWKWVGYAQKGHAKRKLLSCGFVKGVDYEILLIRNDEQNLLSNSGKQVLPSREHGGHNREEIRLTINCALHFAMMAKTVEGRDVREFFIEAANRYRQLLLKMAEQAALPAEQAKLGATVTAVTEETWESVSDFLPCMGFTALAPFARFVKSMCVAHGYKPRYDESGLRTFPVLRMRECYQEWFGNKKIRLLPPKERSA
jgi:phage anti-repressor protein